MQADLAAQRRLIELQAVDTAIAQLQHRLTTLPEHALIAAGMTQRTAAAEAVVAATTQVSDAELRRAKAESDIVPVRERLERNQKRVHDGSITDGKQLTGLVDEVAHLRQRIGDLEDLELDAMEDLETATQTQAEALASKKQIEDEIRAHMAKRDAAASELRADLAERQQQRDAIAADLPADLLALYDKIRVRSGGSGAARLEGRRCTGCGLEATPTEYGRYQQAAPTEVLRCEECDRILVRME